MKPFFFILFSLLLLQSISGLAQIKQPVDYVDPFIGTSNSRWMLFPGVTQPNGMVKLSPDNQGGVWQGGYEYSIGSIHGFSFLHGWTMAGLLTMPTNGDLTLKPGAPDDPFKGAGAGYHSRFRHEDEQASPGYYSVYLMDPKIKIELAATDRTGYQRISFPKSATNRFMVSLSLPAEYGYELKDAVITKVSHREIMGHVQCYAANFNAYTLYFVMQFSKPFEQFNGWVQQKRINDSTQVSGNNDVGAFLTFPCSESEEVIVRTGISFVSLEQAGYNLQVESKDYGWDFDALVRHSREKWNGLLSSIRVKGGTLEDKIKFYTNFYRCFTAKMNMCDANGQYRDANEVIQQLPAGRNKMLGGDAYWNSFWNLNLIWTLTTPDIVRELVNTQLEMYKKTGWLSKGPAGIEYSGIMEGSHEMALITSAYLKGIMKEDLAVAYRAMKKNVTVEPPAEVGGGHPGNPLISEYAKFGYVPFEKGAVSKTLDYAYDDWCVAQLAKFMHQGRDYEFFKSRSGNWRNQFDPKINFIRPRSENGDFEEDFDLFSVKHLVEGNAWQYSLYVPHDIPGLVAFTGRDTMLARLASGFKKSVAHNFAAHALDRTEGQSAQYYINQGNEVNMQAAYLFNYLGRPDLTQYYTRMILNTFYDASPYGGWNGDEDEGQMGAWFVNSALGLFEMNGGTSSDLRIDLTSPLFKEMEITLDPKYYPGKSFVIKAYKNSKENIYIQKAKLNGKILKVPVISFRDIIKGGLLELYMGARPARDLK